MSSAQHQLWCAVTAASAAVTLSTSAVQVATGMLWLSATKHNTLQKHYRLSLKGNLKHKTRCRKKKVNVFKEEANRFRVTHLPSLRRNCTPVQKKWSMHLCRWQLCIAFKSNWYLYPYHIFIESLSPLWSIYIKALCKAFYILEHSKLAAQPGARAEARGPCRCYTLTDYWMSKKSKKKNHCCCWKQFVLFVLLYTYYFALCLSGQNL